MESSVEKVLQILCSVLSSYHIPGCVSLFCKTTFGALVFRWEAQTFDIQNFTTTIAVYENQNEPQLRDEYKSFWRSFLKLALRLC